MQPAAVAGRAGAAAMLHVFISHVADDPEWPREAIEALASAMERGSAQVGLDYWHERQAGRKLSEQEWRAWMTEWLQTADRVLLLGSRAYAERGRTGPAVAGIGRGVAFEVAQAEAWLYERRQHAGDRLWVLQDRDVPLPQFLNSGQAIVYQRHEQARLVAEICVPAGVDPGRWARRLHAMLQDECVSLGVPVGARQARPLISALRLPQSISRFLHRDAEAPGHHQVERHEDLLDAIRDDSRALIEGEPGCGKTFAMLRVLASDLERKRTPVWVKLNHWLDAAEPFEQFVAREAMDLADTWPQHTRAGRGRLFLDGLNELPPGQASHQLAQIEAWMQEHPDASLLASCRQGDLPPRALPGLDERLTLQALRATQVRSFIRNYAGERAADAVFWNLVGGDAFRRAWERRPPMTPDELLDELVAPAAGNLCSLDWLNEADAETLATARDDPARVWSLACNPYLLMLLLRVWFDDTADRTDRADVPRRRVEVLSRHTDANILAELVKCHADFDAPQVQQALTELAARLQHVAERSSGGQGAATLALPWAEVAASEAPALRVAIGASLLRREGALVRFEHQLLHEFYLARYLRGLLSRSEDDVVRHLWRGQAPLWDRPGWVQAFLLLAEYQQTDVAQLLARLTTLQPEIAAAVWEQTRRKSPHWATETLAHELVQRFVQRALPAVRSADFPLPEAAFGRALGTIRQRDGRPLDRRPGLWGWYDAGQRRAVVDIDWVLVDGGAEADSALPPFWMARFPVTTSQFQAFVDDPEGWHDARWWQGLPVSERLTPWTPRWLYTNHPCERVSWWMAVAFCRWLAHICGTPGIQLPSSRQWQRAAAGRHGAEYPWGDTWSRGQANADFLLDMTSACGLFDREASTDPPGIHDLAGNVWEWTDDSGEGGSPHAASAKLEPHRQACGGAWLVKPGRCRSTSLNAYAPEVRLNCLGFRVVRTERS